jgi:hypothetical protein
VQVGWAGGMEEGFRAIGHMASRDEQATMERMEEELPHVAM